LRKATNTFVISACPSVCLSTGSNSASTGRLTCNFIFEYFSKIFREYSSFVKT
jgi:hypothetical protein